MSPLSLFPAHCYLVASGIRLFNYTHKPSGKGTYIHSILDFSVAPKMLGVQLMGSLPFIF